MEWGLVASSGLSPVTKCHRTLMKTYDPRELELKNSTTRHFDSREKRGVAFFMSSLVFRARTNLREAIPAAA